MTWRIIVPQVDLEKAYKTESDDEWLMMWQVDCAVLQPLI
jgi:hypothetical protein